MRAHLPLVGQPLEVLQRLAKDAGAVGRIGRLDLIEGHHRVEHLLLDLRHPPTSSSVLEKLRHQKRLAWKVRSFMGEVQAVQGRQVR